MLSRQQLNRAWLARQLLSQRISNRSAYQTIEYLVGMQAQAPLQPYVGLWSRLESFNPAELVELMVERQVVRISAMRSTIHLLTAPDALQLRSLTQQFHQRAFHSQFRRQLEGIDIEAAINQIESFFQTGPKTTTEISAHLQQHWPERDRMALGMIARTFFALVQVPPRGLWGQSGQVRVATIESWLGAALPQDADLEVVVKRYLTAYGPASMNDMKRWSGLTRLRDVFDRLLPDLRAFQSESGETLYDISDGLLPDPETPAAVRFLPEYDNALIGYADRSRYGDQKYAPLFIRPDGRFRSNLLIDGYLMGTWLMDGTELIVEPFEPVTPSIRRELEIEAERLLLFLTDGDSRATLRIADPCG